ncbi:uncharacterized protein LOC126851400 [Cataglyphis hispanica]|uniref:uncharacterized protein LOC126851400 n=1 Tax=Cataglyphis hispanica TaxID=1086592 RepID=UPI00217FC335|nr:uncharacterized protein LOC126851400 [Cataglyphis hispanica]
MSLSLLTRREEQEGSRPLHIIIFFALAGIDARRRASIATRNAAPKSKTPGLAESIVYRASRCTTTLARIVMGNVSRSGKKRLCAETRVTLVISSLSLAESGPSDPSNRRPETVCVGIAIDACNKVTRNLS